MADKFKLEIYTPQKVYNEMMVDSLTIITQYGQLTILSHHIEFLTNVEISVAVIEIDDIKKHYAVGGGALHFKSDENKAILILHSIESVEEIDENKVIKEKEEAEQRLKNKESYEEQKEAELALRRTINLINAKKEYKDQG